jgi:hypothetical protein
MPASTLCPRNRRGCSVCVNCWAWRPKKFVRNWDCPRRIAGCYCTGRAWGCVIACPDAGLEKHEDAENDAVVSGRNGVVVASAGSSVAVA